MDKMLADYFTKPLQVSLFKKLRNYVMGTTIIPDEERVGININHNDKNGTSEITVRNNDRKASYADIEKSKVNTVMNNINRIRGKIIDQ